MSLFRFTVCGKKVNPAAVKISPEMEEMEMMDRKFQSQMFMGMNDMDRMSNPWDDQHFNPSRVRGGLGGMMGRGPGRGGMVRGRGRMEADLDYMAYNQTGSNFSSPGFGRGGRAGRGGSHRGGGSRGSVKDRLGDSGDTVTINPMFDDLYEKPQSTPVRGTQFERARSKLRSSNPGGYQGPQLGGPPSKTWSN